MSILIWILVAAGLVVLLFLGAMAFWYFLPVILFIWLVWWIASLFRPKRKQRPSGRVYFYTNMNPEDLNAFMNANGQEAKADEPLQLRAPLEDSIDAEYSEQESGTEER